MKTNKSYVKRLKVTRRGKIMMRGKGQNHFNAKESSRKQLNKKRRFPFHMKKGDIARFLQ